MRDRKRSLGELERGLPFCGVLDGVCVGLKVDLGVG